MFYFFHLRENDALSEDDRKIAQDHPLNMILDDS